MAGSGYRSGRDPRVGRSVPHDGDRKGVDAGTDVGDGSHRLQPAVRFVSLMFGSSTLPHKNRSLSSEIVLSRGRHAKQSVMETRHIQRCSRVRNARLRVQAIGICLSISRPDAFRTDIWKRCVYLPEDGSRSGLIKTVAANWAATADRAADPVGVAAVVERALTANTRGSATAWAATPDERPPFDACSQTAS